MTVDVDALGLLEETARRFFGNEAPLSQLRRLRDDGIAFDRSTWNQIVAQGWAATPWPEQYGGLGFGYQGQGIIAEQAGRMLAATPLIASVWLCGSLIGLGGSESQKADLLGRLSEGSLLLALAYEEEYRHGGRQHGTAADRQGDGYVIHGSKRAVSDGMSADLLIVLADAGDDARPGRSLFLVDADAPGIARRPLRLVDGRDMADIDFDGVRVSSDRLIGRVGEGEQLLELALDHGRVGLAAEMLGAASEAFERIIAHLKTRRQFDRIIGSFQSLRHRSADMYCRLEMTRAVVREALAALDDPSASPSSIARLASLAKGQANETFRIISREAIQMHGGIAMTDEFDIGFFLKRAAVAEQMLGDLAFHQDRYARLGGF